MRYALVIIILASSFSAISYLFWLNELKYRLPTPMPAEYRKVAEGTTIDVQSDLKIAGNKPVLIHFFNPECPCSRFNLKHVKSLIKQYSDVVSFAVVVVNEDKDYTEEEIKDRFGLDLPISFNSALAEKCGVYSTPQAVILNENRELYYRGNYNKSRYCTDKASNYAQMALDSLLESNYDVEFSPYALKAYGCELPFCKK